MSMVFCQGCGKQIHESAPTCPHCGAPQRGVSGVNSKVEGNGVTFSQAISICLSKYATFSGRARRSEYWYFMLFYFLIAVVAGIIDAVTDNVIATIILYLSFGLPQISSATRRLHDTGRSGWWQLLYLTLIGGILVLVWLASEGERQENKYGKPV